MTTIQGVVRQCINNTHTQFERLGYVATNFANYSTNGYKCVRFEQMLDEFNKNKAYMKGGKLRK